MADKNIQPDDLILVNRSGVDYRAKVSDLGGVGLDCAGLLDCFNAAPVDPVRFAVAVYALKDMYRDPSDQPENWPKDQDHGLYMYADLCDPVTHEIIPFDQEGHGHSGLDGSILRLPHGYYYSGNCVITACPPTQRLEDEEVVYGVHPPQLLVEDLKVFTGRYDKGTTTTQDLFTTGDEIVNGDVSENGAEIYLELLHCDSWPGGPTGDNYKGYACRSDDFEDGGKYFFRLEFKYNLEPYKMVIILNHDRKPIPGGNSVTTIVNFELPNIPIKPMEDN